MYFLAQLVTNELYPLYQLQHLSILRHHFEEQFPIPIPGETRVSLFVDDFKPFERDERTLPFDITNADLSGRGACNLNFWFPWGPPTLK